MVFDIEDSKQLVSIADDFLNSKPLMLTEGLSEIGEESVKSSGKVSFVAANKRSQGLSGVRGAKFACDKLPPKQRERLDLMVREIEDNLDDVMAEKA